MTASWVEFTSSSITRLSAWVCPRSYATPDTRPEAANADSFGMLGSETPRCSESVIGDGPGPAVHVNGDVFANVASLD